MPHTSRSTLPKKNCALSNNELALSEQQIRESEENFQSLVESAPDAIYISIGEKFAYVNPAMVRLMGATSADQLLGMSLYDRIHPSFHEQIHKRARIVVNQSKPVGLQETVYLKMDGTPVEIESAVATFRYHNHFAGLVILRDISRRKQAEKMLRESEERYRRIVETANEGILEMDETFNMVYVNRRMADMLGYTQEEAIGGNIHSFIAAEDIPDNIPRLKDRREGKSDRFERRFVTKDKRIRWMQVSATPLMDPDGTFRGSFAMCSDITDRKAAEEEIARKNEDIHAAYEQLTATEEKSQAEL